jgi:hypothetical protein
MSSYFCISPASGAIKKKPKRVIKFLMDELCRFERIVLAILTSGNYITIEQLQAKETKIAKYNSGPAILLTLF